MTLHPVLDISLCCTKQLVYLHALGVYAGVSKSDMTLSDDLMAHSTPGCIVALCTTATVLLHKEFLTKSFLAELAPRKALLQTIFHKG